MLNATKLCRMRKIKRVNDDDAKVIEFFECDEALGPHEKNVIEPLDENVKSDMMQPLGE